MLTAVDYYISIFCWHVCRFAFPVLKPPEPFRCKTLASLEEGLGADLAASTAQACAGWLDGSSPASAPDQASLPAQGAAPVWLVHIADTGVRCQPLSTWQVNALALPSALTL